MRTRQNEIFYFDESCCARGGDASAQRRGGGGTLSSSIGLQKQHQRRRLPSSRLPNDLVICATACSHLSGFTRSTLLCLGCILVLMVTHSFSFDKGLREQMLRNTVEQLGGDVGGVGGINKDDEGHGISSEDSTTTYNGKGGGGGRQFTIEILHNTRAAAQSLLDMLDDYYGGRDKATNMFVHSWQAQWMLDDVATWTHYNLVVEGGRMLHVNDNKVMLSMVIAMIRDQRRVK